MIVRREPGRSPETSGASTVAGSPTAFGAQGSPTTVIYSPAGEPVDVIYGGISGAGLVDRLGRLFDLDL